MLNSKLFLVCCFFFFTLDAFADSGRQVLRKADKYFKQEKYTEAITLYEDVFQNSQKHSPRMLLKMAFIYQGLENYTKTLYFLSLYQSYSSDYETILEMEKIAESNNLKGYEQGDIDLIKAFFLRYFFEIIIVLSILFFVLLCLLIYKRLTKEAVLVRYKIIFIITLGLFFFMIRAIPERPKKVIIAKDNTYFLSAPSAGGKVIDVLKEGHRLTLLGKSDIWYKVRWESQEGYIKKFNLFVVEN